MEAIYRNVDSSSDYCEVESVQLVISEQLARDIRAAEGMLALTPQISEIALSTRNGNANYLVVSIFAEQIDDEDEDPTPPTDEVDWRIGTERIYVSKYRIWYRAENKYDPSDFFEIEL